MLFKLLLLFLFQILNLSCLSFLDFCMLSLHLLGFGFQLLVFHGYLVVLHLELLSLGFC